MTAAQAIIAKELRAAFASPIVYVVGAIFLFIFGLLAHALVINAEFVSIRQVQVQGMAATINLNDLVFRPVFFWSAFYLLPITLPLLTMRIFSEERKLRTFELLFTSPVTINEIVAGKFAAVLLLYLSMLATTLIIPLSLATYADFDWTAVAIGYAGLTLLGAFFLAIGVFASALTENQIISAFLSFGLIFTVWLAGIAAPLFGDTTAAHVASYLSYIEHSDRLIRGLVATKDLIYYASGIALMLFLTHRVIESQRWK